MKKAICFVLTLMIIMLMAACGTNDSADDEASADESAAGAENDSPADYAVSQEFFDINYLYQDGVMYYSNEEGLWLLSEDGTSQRIAEEIIGPFATDGQKILYESQLDTSTADQKKRPGSMISVINTDGTQEQVLLQTEEARYQPIMLQHDVLYYIQKDRKVKGELMAYDIASSKENSLMEKVFDVLCVSGSRFYYRYDRKQNNYELYCYHADSDENNHVGNDDEKISYKQKVYYDNDAFYTVATEKNGAKTDITVYALHPDDTTEIVKEIKGIEGRVEEESCVFYDNALYYVLPSDDTDEVYRCAMDADEAEKLTDTGRSGTLLLAGDGVIFQTDDYAFFTNGNELKAIDGLSTHLLENLVMWCDGETAFCMDGKGVAKKTIRLMDEVPSVESYTIPDNGRPASQETGYVATDKTVTRTFSGKFYLTGENAETTYEATNRLPKVLLDSSDADEVNDEIDASFGQIFGDDANDQAMIHVDYVSYLNGDTLSLAIELRYDSDHCFKVYNFDVTTGKRLTNEELFALSDTSLEEVEQQIIDRAPVQFNEMYGNKTSHSDLERTRDGLAYANYFFDSDKQLVTIYDLWGTPGAGDSWLVMPLDAHYQS